MFEPTPIRERTAATGVFTAIALSGMGAFYLLVTGGFAPILPHAAEAEAAPAPQTQYVRVIDSGWAPPADRARFTPTAFAVREAYAEDYPAEALAGGSDVALSNRRAERSYDDIARDIEALYNETAVYRQQEARYDDAVYSDAGPRADDFVYTSEDADEQKKIEAEANAYGSASPW